MRLTLDYLSTDRLHFAARAALNHEPEITPRLKLIELTDQGVAYLNSGVLLFDELASILKNLRSRNPAGIYLDQIFSFSENQTVSDQRFLDELGSPGAPIYAAGFVSSALISGREPLISSDKATFYGPHPRYRSLFSGIGHINFEKNTKIRPIYRLGSAGEIKHLSLLGEDFNFLGVSDLIQPNFVSYQSLAASRRQITDYLGDSNPESLDFIKAGDTVLILPNLFTGSTDFKDTPLGRQAGGYILAAMFNSALTGQWITEPSFYSVVGLTF